LKGNNVWSPTLKEQKFDCGFEKGKHCRRYSLFFGPTQQLLTVISFHLALNDGQGYLACVKLFIWTRWMRGILIEKQESKEKRINRLLKLIPSTLYGYRFERFGF
jgi:hypothetical protein